MPPLTKASKTPGAAVCLVFLEVHEQERKEEVGSWLGGWGGGLNEEGRSQGRNLHSQIDAKQLLKSCKVEQLLGRRGKMSGGDEGMRDEERESEGEGEAQGTC